MFDERNNYITQNNLSSSNFLSPNIIKVNDNKEGLKCKEHDSNFKNFCKTCLLNICSKDYFSHFHFPHELIWLEPIKINNEKLNRIITIINSNNFNDSNANIENTKLIPINDNTFDKITQKDENEFNKFLRIIVNDYKKYPNISHYYNIQNIFYFFNLNDNKENNDNINNNKIIEYEKDEITIKYIKNNSTINLFNEQFVKNNKNKVFLEIEGKNYELKSQYSFENNENEIITIKLIIKEEIFEIDMSEMFANCNNLIYINGISKLKRTKIINQYKMF